MLVARNPPVNAGHAEDRFEPIPGSRRFPGGGHGNPLQYSCLDNPMDTGAWWATGFRVAKSQTQPKRQHGIVKGTLVIVSWALLRKICSSTCEIYGNWQVPKLLWDSVSSQIDLTKSFLAGCWGLDGTEKGVQVAEMSIEAELLPRRSRGAVEYVLAVWEWTWTQRFCKKEWKKSN